MFLWLYCHKCSPRWKYQWDLNSYSHQHLKCTVNLYMVSTPVSSNRAKIKVYGKLSGEIFKWSTENNFRTFVSNLFCHLILIINTLDTSSRRTYTHTIKSCSVFLMLLLFYYWLLEIRCPYSYYLKISPVASQFRKISKNLESR